MVKKQLLSFAACVAFVAAGVVSAAEVNVYSARSEEPVSYTHLTLPTNREV